MRQRLVFLELAVPPMDVLLVQAPLELLADAEQPFLIGLLEAQAVFDELGVEVPLQPRERLDAEAVLAEPVEPVDSLAVGEFGARGAAGRRPRCSRRRAPCAGSSEKS